MTNQELDRWIAENVMGWFIFEGLHINGHYWVEQKPSSTRFFLHVDNWRPTESISDAMMVVEKMEDKDYLFDLVTTLNGFRSASFRHKKSAFRYSELMPRERTALAICLAAKRAIEKD